MWALTIVVVQLEMPPAGTGARILKARMRPRAGAEQWYGGPVRCRRPDERRSALHVAGAVDCGGVHGPSVRGGYPSLPIGGAPGDPQHGHMEVITPPLPVHHRSITPLLRTTFTGIALVVAGLSLAYLAYATPLLASLLPAGHPSVGQLAAGMAVWTLALVAPAGFILVGTNRLAHLLARIRGRMPHRSSTIAALAGLPGDVVVATGLTLPDGRGVADVVIGAFGAAVVRELPPSRLTRIHNGQWQLRTQRGWIPLDDPLQRTVRDAERVRRWLGHDDADFVVKVYAAVVGVDPNVERTTACAVLTPDQLAPWVSALAPQRSLTTGRREQMLDLVREAIA